MALLPSLLRSLVSGVIFGFSLIFSNLTTLNLDNPLLFTEDMLFSGGSRKRVSAVLLLPYPYVLLLLFFAEVSVFSGLAVYMAYLLGVASVSRRSAAEYGWFGFDGNVVGGVVQGVGMAVAVSEPGIAFVRAGMGDERALWTLFGGILGGLGYVLFNERFKRGVKGPVEDVKAKSGVRRVSEVERWRTQQRYVLGMLTVSFVLDWTAGLAGITKADRRRVTFGAALIGSAQFASLLLTGGTLGVSSAYPSLASHVVRLTGGKATNPGYNSIVFSLGLMSSGLFTKMVGSGAVDDVGMLTYRSRITLVLGGFLIIFGARVAGGCTSGHGLSGCSTFSMSSYVTLAAMAVGAASWTMVAS